MADSRTFMRDDLLTDSTRFFADGTHPLRPEFDSRSIDRSGKLRVPITKTICLNHSLIPKVIQTFDQAYLFT